MKNSELLDRDPKLLGVLDRQRRYILRMHSFQAHCPNPGCRQPVNVFEAMGIDIDDYDVSDYNPGQKYKCPHCHYALAKIVPLIMPNDGGYYWELNEPLPKKEG